MISDGAFSIFKRFSAIEKPFHEMPREENNYFLEALEGFKGTFKSSMSSRVQEFKSLIPLPYSLSKEGNIFMVKNIPQGRKDKLDLLAILSHKFRKSRGLFMSTKNSLENQMISL